MRDRLYLNYTDYDYNLSVKNNTNYFSGYIGLRNSNLNITAKSLYVSGTPWNISLNQNAAEIQRVENQLKLCPFTINIRFGSPIKITFIYRSTSNNNLISKVAEILDASLMNLRMNIASYPMNMTLESHLLLDQMTIITLKQLFMFATMIHIIFI